MVYDDRGVVELSARYTVKKTLGLGVMGKVRLATGMRLKWKVAIKRSLSDASGRGTATSCLLTEAKSIEALNHPKVIQIYYCAAIKPGRL